MDVVSASDVQKNFGEWHDRIHKGPVAITRYGRTSAYLISAETFEEMWKSYRVSKRIEDISDAEMRMISESKIESDDAYNLADIPEIEDNAELTSGPSL